MGEIWWWKRIERSRAAATNVYTSQGGAGGKGEKRDQGSIQDCRLDPPTGHSSVMPPPKGVGGRETSQGTINIL